MYGAGTIQPNFENLPINSRFDTDLKEKKSKKRELLGRALGVAEIAAGGLITAIGLASLSSGFGFGPISADYGGNIVENLIGQGEFGASTAAVQGLIATGGTVAGVDAMKKGTSRLLGQ